MHPDESDPAGYSNSVICQRKLCENQPAAVSSFIGLGILNNSALQISRLNYGAKI
jgi:hypothetical protein